MPVLFNVPGWHAVGHIGRAREIVWMIKLGSHPFAEHPSTPPPVQVLSPLCPSCPLPLDLCLPSRVPPQFRGPAHPQSVTHQSLDPS